VWPWIRLVYELFATTLAPDVCAGCDEPVSMLTAFCPACALTLVRAPPLPRAEPPLVAPFLYGGALAQAISRFKYQGRPELARPLSAALVRAARAAQAGLGRVDVVLPVPLHPSRLAVRGYNQAALLAGPLARMLRVPLVTGALARTRDTSQQAKLDRDERLRNLTEAFAVRAPRTVAGRRVLLVDDVRTTGATLRACRDVLVDAGAAGVQSVVVARAP
jgi:ComF family protein